jgi:anti-sigma B factor antagonist
MTTGKPIIVKRLPEKFTLEQAHLFFREMEHFLNADRPRMVFDFSEVRQLDSSGIEVLLRCMEEVMKRNGDLKLAAVPAGPATILELTRVDRLFEVFENTSDAVESFRRFPVHAYQQNGRLWSSRPVPEGERVA